MSDFTPITTQEELNKIVSERVNATKERFKDWVSPDDLEKIRKEYDKQIADLTSASEASAKKYADYDKELADRDAKIKGFETNALKNRIAHETGLQYGAAEFLQGEDEESIKKSAEALKKLTAVNAQGQSARPSPAFKGGQGEPDGVTAAFRKINPNLKI